MIFRTDKTSGNFSQITNDLLRDKTLSLTARGLLCFMLSYPDDWDFSIKFLASGTGQKVGTIKSSLAELKQCGYVHVVKVQNGIGKFIGWAYSIKENKLDNIKI